MGFPDDLVRLGERLRAIGTGSSGARPACYQKVLHSRLFADQGGRSYFALGSALVAHRSGIGRGAACPRDQLLPLHGGGDATLARLPDREMPRAATAMGGR